MPESQSETVALAVSAATQWMEAVTGRRFQPDRTFRATLEDGVMLCELMDNLNPGLLRHTPHLNNVERFLMGCKDLGMSKEQLFEETDLQDPNLPNQSRDKRKSLNERLKSVCLTLFWLSQILDYSGPQLDLTPFTALFPDHQAAVPKEGLTSEEEQTADQLLADIQSAVDEMLNDFQANNLSPDATPPSQPPPQTSSTATTLDKSSYHHYQVDADRESVVIEMRISGGGFGFQVRGGLDTVMNPQVDMVLPGSAAEEGGVKSGDEIISVNDRDVTGLRHADLVAAIRQAGSQGYISLGLLRVVEERPTNPLPPEEELMRQTAALKRMYPKSHQLLDSQMGSMLTPVEEEEFDLLPPLPPLPGELKEPLPPLPGESSTLQPLSGNNNSTFPPPQLSPAPYISPLPTLPGETGPFPLYPGVAAVASVRDSVREMEDLQLSMELSSPSPPPQLPPHPTSPSPPPQLPPHPTSPSPPPQLPPHPTSPSPPPQLPPHPTSPSPPPQLSPHYTSPSPPPQLPPHPTSPSPPPQLPPHPTSPSPPPQLPPHPTSPSPPPQLSPHYTSPSPPPQLSPHQLEDIEEEGTELTSEELEAIVEDLGKASQSLERGEGEGEEQRVEKREEEDEGKVTAQPWEPKAQWEDNNVRVGERERAGERKKVKIWSFLEEKTRVSNEERAQASSKHTPQQAPVFRKPLPPKVLPKPVRKKSVEQPPVVEAKKGGGEVGGGEEEVFIPSRDPNMITIQSTSSTEPLNVRPIMAEEVELHGDIKIQKVAHTRWTPQKKSQEQVQRPHSNPVTTPPTATLPKPPTRQEGRYGEGTPPGPVKQMSLPQFSRGGQQPKGPRGQRLAEQTRVVNIGPPVGGSPQPAATRGRVQSTGQQMENGGPSYDSLRNVARDIRQQSIQQSKARSRTWGPRERSQFTGQPAQPARPSLATMMPDIQRQDGPQQAFLVRPADPNLPCSLCHRPLGPQPPLIAIPGLHLHFHPQCFVCPVCHTYLTPPRGQSSTTVMVRSMRPHCHYCTSNTQGVQATEC